MAELLTLRRFQKELKEWSDHNFSDTPSVFYLLGVAEEVGEFAQATSPRVFKEDHTRWLSVVLGHLTHSHLKEAQDIYKGEDHGAKAKDAIGDIVVFLADYCNMRGWDLEEIINNVWSEVKKRDWIKFPRNGLTE